MAKKSRKKKQGKQEGASQASEKAQEPEIQAQPVGLEAAQNLQPTEEGSKAKVVVNSTFAQERVVTESNDDARELYNKSRYGSMLNDSKVQLSLLEALYLVERGKLHVKSGAGKIMHFDAFLKKARKLEPNFWIRYCVFKDIRDRGYIIKTALKFGADFRVYDRGIKPGEDHAKWVVFPVHEATTLTWHEFSAKNRVAHSTKKRLLIGIVDAEGDVTYYEIRWVRP